MTNKQPRRGSELDLSELSPARDVIRDEDGKVYELCPASEFSAAETARMSRVQARYRNAQKMVGRGKAKNAEAQIEQASFDLIRIILPEMPVERIKAIPVGTRGLMVDFWMQKEEERREAIGLKKGAEADFIEDVDDEDLKG